MAMSSPDKKTPLHAQHVALGARMISFGGFDMPIQYSGIIDEHMAVREAAGLFDVSHMGEVFVHGPQAFAFVQNLVTNDVSKLYDGKALYAVMCRPDGTAIDDLLVYRIDAETYLLVINASNIDKDVAWMRANNPMGAELEDVSDKLGLLALQGPNAFAIFEQLTGKPVDLAYYHFEHLPSGSFFDAETAIVSRTGYTGEPGLELYIDADRVGALWAALMETGQSFGLKPAGLGARDTLRLEAGYCLYGNELDDNTNPLEAGLGWVTKLKIDDFIGRDALLATKAAGLQRKLVGFVMDVRGIPRHGYSILDADGHRIGTVTSGSQSPVLNKGIGLGFVTNDPTYTKPGQTVFMQARKKALPATVTKPPFHKA